MSEEPKILLHPEKGLNPHMTRCTTCGKDGEDIILLGIAEYKFVCNDCGMTHYGFRSLKVCEQCEGRNLKKEEIKYGEKLPGKCRKCREKEDEQQAKIEEIIAAGGIMMRCEECGMEGVVEARSPICEMVRLKLKVPSGPCGIEFQTCSEHSGVVSA